MTCGKCLCGLHSVEADVYLLIQCQMEENLVWFLSSSLYSSPSSSTAVPLHLLIVKGKAFVAICAHINMSACMCIVQPQPSSQIYIATLSLLVFCDSRDLGRYS